MKNIIILSLAILAFVYAESAGTINVVTSTTDLKSIAEYIGGDRVAVKSIASGSANPHFIEVLPSYMVMVTRADVYLKIGLDLDFWAQPIIDGSRNGKLLIVDCSQGVEPMEKPTSKIDASMGDIHPQGNPHYWLDPNNASIIAGNIARGLIKVDPAGKAIFESNLAKFTSKLQEKMIDWQKKATPLKGTEIITYHNSWPYFSQAFGLTVAGFVEPKPGIEPTPSHTADIIELVNSHGITVIGKEPYFSDKSPKVIASATGAKIVNMPPSVGGDPQAVDYFSLIDTLLDKLLTAAIGK